MVKILAIGDNCIDDYTNRNVCFPGGGCVNFAVQARRVGAETAYAGVIGDDQHGDWILNALQAEQVNTDQLRRISGKTAIAYVELRDTERVFLGSDRGVRERIVIDDPMRSFINEFDHIHTTLDGRVDDYIAEWYANGKSISYDFSHRSTSAQHDLLPYIPIAFFSGQRMTDTEAIVLAQTAQQRNQGVVVVTFGADGSIACVNGDILRQPAMSANVVDTLGAGDAFQAGFVVEYLHSHNAAAALLAGTQRAVQACEHLGGFGYPH